MNQNSLINVTVNDAEKVAKYIKEQEAKKDKAYKTAIKVEGFRLKDLLKEDIRKGAPGGKQFAPLSYIRRHTGKRLKPDKPLSRLAVAVKYHVKDEKPYKLAIGWTGPRVSKSWKRLATKHQEGFSQDIPDWKRKSFAKKGDMISERSRARKYHYLRKETKRFKVPARPIIDPFMDRHKAESKKQIVRNFKLKMQGKRI